MIKPDSYLVTYEYYDYHELMDDSKSFNSVQDAVDFAAKVYGKITAYSGDDWLVCYLDDNDNVCYEKGIHVGYYL